MGKLHANYLGKYFFEKATKKTIRQVMCDQAKEEPGRNVPDSRIR